MNSPLEREVIQDINKIRKELGLRPIRKIRKATVKYLENPSRYCPIAQTLKVGLPREHKREVRVGPILLVVVNAAGIPRTITLSSTLKRFIREFDNSSSYQPYTLYKKYGPKKPE